MAATSSPRPFTAEDFAKRMQRAAEQAEAAGLTGVLVTPGPDLIYLAGYAPVAITERLTVLIVQKDREPAMVLPVLERPDAEAAPSAGTIALTDWADGSDPYAAAAPLLDRAGSYAISDSAWALQLLGLQQALPDTRFVAMTNALPMLRAIKDADELERLAAAGAAADATLEELVKAPFAGRRETEIAADLDRLLRRTRPLPGGLHRGRLRAQRRQPAPRDGRANDRGGRHGRARLRRAQGRLRI